MMPLSVLLSPNAPPARRVARCEHCRRAEVPAAGHVCEPCRPAYDREREAARIRLATASLPSEFELSLGGDGAALLERIGAPPDVLREAELAIDARRTVILGASGRGKTTLAVAIARQILRVVALGEPSPAETRRARGLRFLPAIRLGRAYNAYPLGEGRPPLVEEAERASYLVLDDLGREPPRSGEALVETLHERVYGPRQTLVTTMLGEAELTRRYGEDVVRRLFDRAVVIDLGGAS